MRLPLILLLIVFVVSACGNHNNAAELKRHQLAVKADSVSKQRFKTLEFIVDGKPAYATIDTRYAHFKGKKEFPLSLFITISTINKDSLGHPTKKEAEIYSAIEKDIVQDLGQLFVTAFIGNTTMNGYRDLIFYIKSQDQKKVSETLFNLQKQHSRIKEYVFEEDADWEAVESLYNALTN